MERQAHGRFIERCMGVPGQPCHGRSRAFMGVHGINHGRFIELLSALPQGCSCDWCAILRKARATRDGRVVRGEWGLPSVQEIREGDARHLPTSFARVRAQHRLIEARRPARGRSVGGAATICTAEGHTSGWKRGEDQ